MAETKTITSISKHNGTDERYYRVHFSDNSTETVWEAGNRMDALQRLMKSAFKAEREMLGGRYTNYVPIVVEQPTNASAPAASADADHEHEAARGEYAVGDYVMFGTADGDTAGGVITSIVDGEYTIDEGNGVTYMRHGIHINRKIDMTPKISPFQVGDRVGYIGTNKKLKGSSGQVVSVDGTSSYVQFGNSRRPIKLVNSTLELVARATSEPAAAQTPPANEAGTGDIAKGITTLTDMIERRNEELDAKDATIAKLQADNDMLRAVLQNIANNAPQSESTINYGNAHAIAWAFWVAGVNAKSVLVIIEREEAID